MWRITEHAAQKVVTQCLSLCCKQGSKLSLWHCISPYTPTLESVSSLSASRSCGQAAVTGLKCTHVCNTAAGHDADRAKWK